MKTTKKNKKNYAIYIMPDFHKYLRKVISNCTFMYMRRLFEKHTETADITAAEGGGGYLLNGTNICLRL